MHEMKLVEGEGNTYDSHGKALEGDKFNTVFIVVSLSPLSAGQMTVIPAETAPCTENPIMETCITEMDFALWVVL